MFTFLPIVYWETKFSEINKRTGTFIREIRVLISAHAPHAQKYQSKNRFSFF